MSATTAFRHGGLCLDLPVDWADRSTLLFVAPPSDEGSLPEAVSIRLAYSDDDPRAVLAAQEAQLRALDPELERVSEGAFASALGDGWQSEYRLCLEGVEARQIGVACATDELLVFATASAGAERFDAVADRLRTILGSLRPASESA
jgi:hypothetical protein